MPSTLVIPRTWVDNTRPSNADFKTELTDSIDFLLNPPKIKLRQATAQTGLTGTSGIWTDIGNWSPEVDSHGFFGAGATTRITPTVPGWYKGWFGVSWAALSTAADTTGVRVGLLAKNGTNSDGYRQLRAAWSSGIYTAMKGVRFHVYCNGTTDYLQVRAGSNSGSTHSTNVAWHGVAPEFFMRWWAV